MLTLRTPLIFLLPLRLICGWVLCTAGFGKISSGWLSQPLLRARLEEWLHSGRTYGFFVPALHKVLPHALGVGIAIALLEMVAGAALLAGLFSRTAAFAGFLLMTAYLLAMGEGPSANPAAPLAVALLTLALTGPGRVFGLDQVLARGREEE